MAKRSSTESDSFYDHLEKMEARELLESINREDQKVAQIIAGIIPEIESVVRVIVQKMQNGGRLFYIGSGTSGRLGIVDASECPPTFGVDSEMVIGIIAGGDKAIRVAQEGAEDDLEQGWKDLQKNTISEKDFLIGITASGLTPYVVGAVKQAMINGISTAGITCNDGTALETEAGQIIKAIVGPEFVTGSTRMKAGTAQKLILNMISTSVMIKLGHVEGNKMIDLRPSNDKLIERGKRIIMESTGVSESEATLLLEKYKNVRDAIKASKAG